MKRKIGEIFSRLGARLQGYDGGETSKIRRDLGWGRAVPRDEDSLVGTDGSRETLRLKAADLRRNNPVVAGVCERLASFVVGPGIRPQAQTASVEWNRTAEDYFNQWAKVADYRQRVSWWQLQRMAVSLRPTHGGVYIELIDNGQVRPIETERIRQPASEAEAKAFVDGVKVDPGTGIKLGYKVHARDSRGGFSEKHEERFVARENMKAVITPPWRPDQVREVPDFAPIIPALTDIHEANLYTLGTYKAQSQYIAVLKKIGGMGANSLPRGSSTPTVGQRQTFKTDWGAIMEAFPGEDLEMKVSPTPNPTHIPYIKLQLMLAASALDVPYEFLTLDFSTADFSRQKAILLLVNKAMRNWQAWLNETMNQPIWNWVIARAMKYGEIPQAPIDASGVSQWWRVDWQAPEEPWSDRQEAQQADVLEIQMGVATLTGAAKKRGRDLEDTLRTRARELNLINTIAAEYGVAPEQLSKLQIPGQTEPAKKQAEEMEDEDELEPVGSLREWQE